MITNVLPPFYGSQSISIIVLPAHHTVHCYNVECLFFRNSECSL